MKVGSIIESINSTTIQSDLLLVADVEVVEEGFVVAEVALEEDFHSEEETWVAGLAITTRAADHMINEDMEAYNLKLAGNFLPGTSHRD